MVFDLYEAFVVPSALIAAVALWNIVPTFIRRRGDVRFLRSTIDGSFLAPKESKDAYAASRRYLLISLIVGVVSVLIFLLSPVATIKLSVWIWNGYKLLAFASVIVACYWAWESAQKRKWLRFTVAVWAIIASIMSGEYARRHAWNALRHTDPSYADYLLHRDPADDPASDDIPNY